ncbi:hypothetical protein CRENBAI_000520 [Crenichthys baileyi]|uniref:Uncharacterized protein n=1 Tax=Crenichthys baileyi TaxID=28760 RepID=A0AAV9S5P2_9TELE
MQRRRARIRLERWRNRDRHSGIRSWCFLLLDQTRSDATPLCLPRINHRPGIKNTDISNPPHNRNLCSAPCTLFAWVAKDQRRIQSSFLHYPFQHLLFPPLHAEDDDVVAKLMSPFWKDRLVTISLSLSMPFDAFTPALEFPTSSQAFNLHASSSSLVPPPHSRAQNSPAPSTALSVPSSAPATESQLATSATTPSTKGQLSASAPSTKGQRNTSAPSTEGQSDAQLSLMLQLPLRVRGTN